MKAFEGMDPWKEIYKLKRKIEDILKESSSLDERIYFKVDPEIVTAGVSIYYPLSFKTVPTSLRHLIEHIIANIIIKEYPILKQGPRVDSKGIYIIWGSYIPREELGSRRIEMLLSDIADVISNFEETVKSSKVGEIIEYEIKRTAQELKDYPFSPYHDIWYEFGVWEMPKVPSRENLKERLINAYHKMIERIVSILAPEEVSRDILVKIPSGKKEDVLKIKRPSVPPILGVGSRNRMDIFLAVPLEYLLSFYSWNSVIVKFLSNRKFEGSVYSFYVGNGIEESLEKSIFYNKFLGKISYRGSIQEFRKNLEKLEESENLRDWEILQLLYLIYNWLKGIPILPQHAHSVKKILEGLN